jgi:hypothetical protein
MAITTEERTRIIESGRFIERNKFLEKNPNENLHRDCTDVVHYYDGSYIQLLKTGEFYLSDDLSSKSLDEAETMLIDKKEKNLLNNI